MIRIVESPRRTLNQPLMEKREQEFDNETCCEVTLEEEMAWALSFISQLETRISLLQHTVSQGERKLAVKDALLRNAAVRERVLRAQVALGSIVGR
jgi:flagellar biosynthesis chaperone FliJ